MKALEVVPTTFLLVCFVCLKGTSFQAASFVKFLDEIVSFVI